MPEKLPLRILDTYADVEPFLKTVREAADANRDALGFFRPSAYQDLAFQGKLWVAVVARDSSFAGHLLFGGTFPGIKIFQLFVSPNHQRKGVGQALVGKLIEYGERRGCMIISARVASDLREANHFWADQHFSCVRQLPGGKSRNRVINWRVRNLDTPSLLDWMVPEPKARFGQLEQFHFDNTPLFRPRSYAIDLNVLFDVLKNRARKEASSAVFKAGFNRSVSVHITNEFLVELRRNSPPDGVDPILEIASHFPVLPDVNINDLSPITEKLRRIVFPDRQRDGRTRTQDISDLRHLALSIHHRLTGFVTGEAAILRAQRTIRDQWGLDILSPTDFLTPLDDSEQSISPVRVQVQQLRILASHFLESERPEIEKFLLGLGINHTDISVAWSPGSAKSPQRRICVRSDQQLVGLASWDNPLGLVRDINSYLFVNEDHGAADTVIDHLLESVSRDCTVSKALRVLLHVRPEQALTHSTALTRGYRPSGKVSGQNGFLYIIKLFFDRIITSSSWEIFSREFATLTGFTVSPRMPDFGEVEVHGVKFERKDGGHFFMELFDFETLCSPAVFLFPNRSGIMVPIWRLYAEELLGATSQQFNLFPAKEASMRLEKAYYRKPRRQKFLKNGAPAVFYISGKGGGTKQAVGCGRVTFNDIRPVEDVHLHFQRQGVLEKEELRKRANTRGEVQVFTFDNFKPFVNAVPFIRLERLGIKGSSLISTRAIDDIQLEAICREGFGV